MRNADENLFFLKYSKFTSFTFANLRLIVQHVYREPPENGLPQGAEGE